jgi:hypothetical protein
MNEQQRYRKVWTTRPEVFRRFEQVRAQIARRIGFVPTRADVLSRVIDHFWHCPKARREIRADDDWTEEGHEE